MKETEVEPLLEAPGGMRATTCRSSVRAGSRTPRGAGPGGLREVAAVIQLHRLREVVALAGFTRFEAVTPDIHGKYETDLERASIALEPSWFPAVENRGQLFLRLRSDAIEAWLARRAVCDRLDGSGPGGGNTCVACRPKCAYNHVLCPARRGGRGDDLRPDRPPVRLARRQRLDRRLVELAIVPSGPGDEAQLVLDDEVRRREQLLERPARPRSVAP